ARRCARCGSTSLDVSNERIDPPLPDRIRNLGEAFVSWHNTTAKSTNEHVWGVDTTEDGVALARLCHSYRVAEDGHRHLYLLLAFARTLSARVLRDKDPEDFNFILNLGNVAQRTFELTADPEYARTMLDCFERAVGWLDDPIPVGMAKHSFGMA